MFNVEQGFGPSNSVILIEEGIWTGANCVILDGAVVGRGCVVGADTLVRDELPEYSICVLTPETRRMSGNEY